MTHPAAHRLAAAALAVVLAGCQNPYATNPSARAAGRSPQHDSAPSGSPSNPVTASPGAQRIRARDAAAVFARLWITWEWRSAPQQQRALAQLATGRLARDLRANATSSHINASLVRDKPSSRGTVAAINLTTTRTRRAAGIIVTREQTYTDGHPDLGGRHYRVYRIRLRQHADRWAVTTWAPQP
jgi:hypothetical protein